MTSNNSGLIRSLAAEWRVTLGNRIPGATCSDIFEAFDDSGAELVLKLPHEEAEERKSYPTSLAFSGFGGVPIYRYHEASGGLLMPRLKPGGTLDAGDLGGDEQVQICADLILNLRMAPPAPTAFSLSDWFESFGGLPDTPIVRAAERVARELFATAPTGTLLHGDLHHFNILQAEDRWIAIDPKGLTGDPAFEFAGFLRNPNTRSISAEESRQRILRFHQLSGDPIERIWGWAFAETVLCAGWSTPDDIGEFWPATAEGLFELMGEFWRDAI